MQDNENIKALNLEIKNKKKSRPDIKELVDDDTWYKGIYKLTEEEIRECFACSPYFNEFQIYAYYKVLDEGCYDPEKMENYIADKFIQRIVRKLAKGGKIKKFNSYYHVAVHNLIIDFKRKEGCYKEKPLPKMINKEFIKGNFFLKDVYDKILLKKQPLSKIRMMYPDKTEKDILETVNMASQLSNRVKHYTSIVEVNLIYEKDSSVNYSYEISEKKGDADFSTELLESSSESKSAIRKSFFIIEDEINRLTNSFNVFEMFIFYFIYYQPNYHKNPNVQMLKKILPREPHLKDKDFEDMIAKKIIDVERRVNGVILKIDDVLREKGIKRVKSER